MDQGERKDMSNARKTIHMLAFITLQKKRIQQIVKHFAEAKYSETYDTIAWDDSLKLFNQKVTWVVYKRIKGECNIVSSLWYEDQKVEWP